MQLSLAPFGNFYFSGNNRSVELIDVLETERCQVVVARIHLLDYPLQDFCSLLGVCDDRGNQMRHTLIAGELDSLRVDQDHANLGRLRAHED